MRRQATLVFVFFSLLYVLSNSFRETVQVPDEEYVLVVTSNLANGRSLALPPSLPRYVGATDQGRDGKIYSSYQIGQSLVYLPFYWAFNRILAFSEPYDRLRHKTLAEYDTWLERQTRRYLYLCPSLFTALSCAILFLFALRLGYSSMTGLILTLFYGLGTMAWPYSKYLLTEASQNALLWVTVYLLFAQKTEGTFRFQRMLWAGGSFGLLLSIRASFLILLPVLAAYWFYRNRERRLLLPLLGFTFPLAGMVLPQLLYNHHRFGGVTALGYGGGTFSNPLIVGLYGYLASPGKGFFFYNPILLAVFFGFRSFFRRAPAEAVLIGVVSALVPLMYAGWWVWSGDPAWGPRYLLVLTPFLVLPVGEVVERAISSRRIWKRGLLAGLFALSMFVQFLAVSSHYLHYHHYMKANGSLMEKARYLYARKTGIEIPLRDPNLETEFIPEYSPIAGQWWVLKSLLSSKRLTGEQAPWSGLGYARLHANEPLRAEWDLWIVDLVVRRLHWINVRLILGALALVVLISWVGQELFSAVRGSRPKE